MMNFSLSISRDMRMPIATMALIMAAACWGAGMILSKLGLDYFPPLFLLIVELSASCAVLWGVILLRGEQVHLRWSKLAHGWSGMLEPGLSHILGMFGLALTSASNASLIGATEPIAAMVVAWVVLREGLSRRALPWIGAALVGTLLVSSAGGAGGASFTGDLLTMLATLAAAGYVVASSRSVAHLSPLLLAALQQTTALGFTVVIWLFTRSPAEGAMIAAIPASAWVWVIVSGLVQYTLAFWLYLLALRTISAARAASFLMLVPVFGVAGAVMFLREVFTLMQFLGGLLVMLALAFAHREDIPAESPAQQGIHPPFDPAGAAVGAPRLPERVVT